MRRMFFALWPDPEIRLQLQSLQQLLNQSGLKKTRPQNLHVTLAFLGNIPDLLIDKIRMEAGSVQGKSFQICFEQVAFWRKPGIVCLTAGQQSEHLLALVSGLSGVASCCGIDADARPYKAHITLARNAKCEVKMLSEPLCWKADHFVLAESVSTKSGVKYQVLQRWPLLENHS